MVSARAQAQPREGFSRTSPSGSYLAARHAGGQRDVAAAASYYRAALRGGNNEVLGHTFLAVLANGEVDEGVRLAERVLQVEKNDRIARLVLGVRALKQKQYPVARRELAQSIRGPITDLAATLLAAWTMANPTEAKQATDSIDKLAGADWYAIFKELHTALILDVAGQKKEAAKHFERSYKLDPTAMRVVQSYASFLSRHGNNADALKVFAAFEERRPPRAGRELGTNGRSLEALCFCLKLRDPSWRTGGSSFSSNCYRMQRRQMTRRVKSGCEQSQLQPLVAFHRRREK
jgi:tetratricopeptide (TPR) repeat protein